MKKIEFFVGVCLLKEKINIDDLISISNEINAIYKSNGIGECFVSDHEDTKPGYNLIYKIIPDELVFEMFASVLDHSNDIEGETVMHKANNFMQAERFDDFMPLVLEKMGFGLDVSTMVFENEILFEIGYK